MQDQEALFYFIQDPRNTNLKKRVYQFVHTLLGSWIYIFQGPWRWCEHTARVASRSMERQWLDCSGRLWEVGIKVPKIVSMIKWIQYVKPGNPAND